MVECENVESEKLAKHLSKLTGDFKLWIHGSIIYASFNVESFSMLTEFRRRLKRMKTGFRFIKIQTVSHET